MRLRFAWLPLLMLVPRAALACEPTETFLFTCPAGSPDRSLSLCAGEEDRGEGMQYTGLRFVYHTEKGDEISYPPNPADGPKSMFFSHAFQAGLYTAQLRFEAEGKSYRLFYKDAPEGGAAEPTGGLEVSSGGVVQQTYACSEAPSWYFEQTRAIVACDMQSPFGAAGCGATPPSAP